MTELPNSKVFKLIDHKFGVHVLIHHSQQSYPFLSNQILFFVRLPTGRPTESSVDFFHLGIDGGFLEIQSQSLPFLFLFVSLFLQKTSSYRCRGRRSENWYTYHPFGVDQRNEVSESSFVTSFLLFVSSKQPESSNSELSFSTHSSDKEQDRQIQSTDQSVAIVKCRLTESD